ncbi:MAG: nucleotidyltransferase substrate binding protein [Candidatus Omnitrophica bacterium]|nr:nucleotidyltransferase substrate binding protein [Candidatus Omnitrophota bacterium]
MEREKFKRIFEKFEKALEKFKRIIQSKYLSDFLNRDLIIEATTKRFEYTFESMWKTLKEHLREEGVECSTPLKCFKEAFKAGIIDEQHESLFPEMIEKRNLIVHVYDSEQAENIYEFIKREDVFSAIKSVYKQLKRLLT